MGCVISCFSPIGAVLTFQHSNSASSIFAYFGGKAQYICCLESNLDVLLSESDKMIRIKMDLLNDVEVAEQRFRMRRTSQVEGWIQRVEQKETKIEEVRQLRDQEIDRLCPGGFCSKDLIATYHFGEKVAKLKNDVNDLMVEREEQIKDVAIEVPEDSAVVLAIDQPRLVGQELFDKIRRCIQEDDAQVRVIGLYGSGGVGKTTLLKRLNNYLPTEQNFVVIFSVVSQNPDLKQIQLEIGRRIGLSGGSWETKSLRERAGDICNILSKKKFVLFLDDIWDRNPIDLTELGVPLQSSIAAASKVVFTTRFSSVCGKMQADKEFEMLSLSHGEAFDLFQEVVGRDFLNNHPEILKVAESLARECDGLPLALVILGRTMKSKKTVEEWEDAIIGLRMLEDDFSDMEEKVYSNLKYSYDNLCNEKIKSCLLYCSLFPEDSSIPKRELVDYWISEGFVDDYRKGSKAIFQLLHACLLEEDGNECVKMHDVVRDMALWIACKIEKEEHNFLVRGRCNLSHAPKIDEWKGVRRVALMNNKIKSLLGIPDCPRLQTLFLDGNMMMHISDGFFPDMPALTVLGISDVLLTKLPSEILSLVLLQHLDLSLNAEITELPQEMKALVNLRYLNLESTIRMKRIPQKLISSFSKLQVIKMFHAGRFVSAIVEEGNVLSAVGEQLIKELLSLEHLQFISLTFKSSSAVQKFFLYPRLYRITESLYIKSCDGPLLPDIRQLAYVERDKLAFISLHRVELLSCSSVKDLTWLIFAPNLQHLDVRNCNAIVEIIRAEYLSAATEKVGELNLFGKLQSLHMSHSYSLRSIYRNPLPFPELKKIEVFFCPELKKLPFNASSCSEKESKIAIRGDFEWWEKLEWEDQATENAFSSAYIVQ